MRTSDTYVRARIDSATKHLASSALEDMGISMSEAIRLLLLHIADEKKLPFEVKTPNKATLKAISELEAGKGTKHNSIEDLMADLNDKND